MKWVLVLALCATAGWAYAETPQQELIRLRKENAELKAELAKLKAELDEVNPAPKATKYTPEQIIKLIPPANAPVGKTWDQDKMVKAQKAIEAQIKGEWIEFLTPLANMGDRKGWMSSPYITAGGMKFRYVCHMADEDTKPNPRPASFAGKVSRIYANQNAATEPPVLEVVLEECRPVKH